MLSKTRSSCRTLVGAVAICFLVTGCDPNAKPIAGPGDGQTPNPANAPIPPANYRVADTYQCPGRLAITKLVPINNNGNPVQYRQGDYIEYEMNVVRRLRGYSSDDPSFGSELLKQINKTTGYFTVSVRAVPGAAADDTSTQYTPIVQAQASTGQPATATVTPSALVFGPVKIAHENPMRFDIAYTDGQSVDSKLPELIADAVMAGAAATSAGAIPVAAVNAIKAVTPKQKADADTWFDNALSYDDNKNNSKPQCPINLTADDVVAGTALYVSVLDRGATEADAVSLIGFQIVPSTKRTLIGTTNGVGDVVYNSQNVHWTGESFLEPIVGTDQKTIPKSMLTADQRSLDDIYVKLASPSPTENLVACRNLFQEQPYSAKGFNDPDTAALNWSALKNAGSVRVPITDANKDLSPPDCPSADQQAQKWGATDLVDIPPFGHPVVDPATQAADQVSERHSNLQAFEEAFAKNPLDLTSAGLAKHVLVGSDASIDNLPTEPVRLDPADLVALFGSYPTRYVSNTQAVGADALPVKIRLGNGRPSYPAYITFGSDNTIVALCFCAQPLPAMASLPRIVAEK